MPIPYRGRFAPSPTGPLHAGSLVAALASWLDARAHGGAWLVRIEDVDTPRCIPGADQTILHQLERCGLHPDAPPVWQSQRGALYQTALDALCAQGLAYPCACSRKEIEESQALLGFDMARHKTAVYPGTCRPDHGGLKGKPARAWRLQVPPRADTPDGLWHWHDRRLGPQSQHLAQAVGDFVIRRADGLWAYQMAVVVDDGEQGITDIVRGEDLTDTPPRQLWLQQCLGLPTPRYLHTPLVCGANGEKLSKQNGAAALDLTDPLAALSEGAQALGLPAPAHPHNISVADALALWAKAWPRIYNGAS